MLANFLIVKESLGNSVALDSTEGLSEYSGKIMLIKKSVRTMEIKVNTRHNLFKILGIQ